MKSSGFDPFGDFDTAGYLRNIDRIKDPRIVKRIEHEAFLVNMPAALEHLANQRQIGYETFLETHRILFSDFYPWAGQDRAATSPHLLVSKGPIKFCLPQDIRRAIESGLRLTQGKNAMQRQPGQVMGLFAFGHPFLDGNGRTLLLVHLELSYRAGFSIRWEETQKDRYLRGLSEEIESPGRGILDSFLLPFQAPRLARTEWASRIGSIQGLDGLDEENEVEGDLRDVHALKAYRKFETARGYQLVPIAGCDPVRSDPGVLEKDGYEDSPRPT